MKTTNFIFTILILASCFACSSDSTSALKPVDLLEYGIPLTIQTPVDSPSVAVEDWIIKTGVTVTANEDYDLQIFYQTATSTDLTKLKATQLAEVKAHRYFSKIVEENESGFIYETKLDSTHTNYGFRHVRIQGDKEYLFQPSLVGTFSLEDAQLMYQSVQSK